jgi:hypothetical protein
VRHIGHLDLQLIEDGKLFAGRGDADDDNRLLDPATEPARGQRASSSSSWARTLAGFPLYRAFGFEETERMEVTMPDGVAVTVIAMRRAIT